MHRRGRARRALMAWLLLGTTALAACSRSGETPAKAEGRAPGVAVVVAQVTARDVPVRMRAIGNVQASATASVLAQIGGEITKIHFKEGQDVATGDLLFTIDPRTFEAALQQARAQLAQHQAQITQAEANLARDKAQHDNAVVEEDRYRRLVDGGMIAREQYDQIRTNELSLAATIKAGQAAVETARAVVRADEAAVENMRLQLAYTEIRAPFDGRTGNVLLHQGNVVKANDVGNPLVVINRIHPIYVTFAVPADYVLRMKSRWALAGSVRTFGDLNRRVLCPTSWFSASRSGTLSHLRQLLRLQKLRLPSTMAWSFSALLGAIRFRALRAWRCWMCLRRSIFRNMLCASAAA